MKHRKELPISEATEDELLRCQMENVVRTSENDIEGLGECSEALAKMYCLLKYRHIGFFLSFLIIFYTFVCFFVFVKKLFRR